MFTTDNIIITTIQLHYDHNEIIPYEVSMHSRKWHNIPVITSAFYWLEAMNLNHLLALCLDLCQIVENTDSFQWVMALMQKSNKSAGTCRVNFLDCSAYD